MIDTQIPALLPPSPACCLFMLMKCEHAAVEGLRVFSRKLPEAFIGKTKKTLPHLTGRVCISFGGITKSCLMMGNNDTNDSLRMELIM